MLADGHIGRLAVLKPYRGMGLGSAALSALIREAARLGLPRVYLGAQIQAVEFYRKLGFTEYGEPFVEAGIEHVAMQKAI
jgi:predicted GNAT family N-acyltransferase